MECIALALGLRITYHQLQGKFSVYPVFTCPCATCLKFKLLLELFPD